MAHSISEKAKNVKLILSKQVKNIFRHVYLPRKWFLYYEEILILFDNATYNGHQSFEKRYIARLRA